MKLYIILEADKLMGKKRTTPETWTVKAKSFLAKGDLINAVSCARNAIYEDHENITAWHILSDVVLKQERHYTALKYYRTLRRLAVKNGDSELSGIAKEKISELNLYFKNFHLKMGYTNLTHFTRKGDLNKIQYYLSAGEEINGKDYYGSAPVHIASEIGNMEILKFLVDHGADINLRNGSRETPLMIAAGYGYLPMMKYLIKLKADIKVMGRDRHTALWNAIYTCRKNGPVRLLVSCGADVNEIYEDGSNPLLLALNCEAYSIAAYLLPLTADINIRNRFDLIPVNLCAARGKFNLLRALISMGADVNKTTSWGKTALMEACEHNFTSCAKLLLQNGADTEKVTVYSQTALSLAVEKNNKSIIRLLEGYRNNACT